MTYSSGGLIQATDYNGFVGGATTPSGTINYVWSTGNGSYGYGQSALSQVSTSGLVTATQWATAINTLNSINTHQSGSGTGIGAPTAGSLIAYLSTLSGAISTINTNHNNFATQGSTTTGTVYTASVTQATQGAVYGPSIYATRSVTFSSGDAARYFFNAGGQINLVITGVTNNDGTSRSADAVSTIGTYLGGVSAFRASTNGGRTGTGGTATTNNTSFGYYNLTTSAQTTQQITTTSGTYGGDYAYVQYYSSTQNASGNGDKGVTVYIALGYYGAAHSGSFNDTLNVTVSHRVDVVYPESTNLSNTWGTATVA
jgi:hypothetical protein